MCLSSAGDGADQVVTARRDIAEAEPRIACDQTAEIAQRNDFQIVLANGITEKLGVLLDDIGSNVELALGHQIRLLTQVVR